MPNKEPAFPRGQEYSAFGMNLLDYFAAKALQGLLSDEAVNKMRRHLLTAMLMP
jgi:hypothetical protein